MAPASSPDVSPQNREETTCPLPAGSVLRRPACSCSRCCQPSLTLRPAPRPSPAWSPTRPARRSGRHGHRHQPGHERHLRRGLQRRRQLHDHVAAGRHLCRQGRADRLPHRHHGADRRSKRSRSPASTSRWRSARSQETVEVTGTLADPADRDGDGRRSHLRQHRAVAAAQRPQHRPARAAPARAP